MRTSWVIRGPVLISLLLVFPNVLFSQTQEKNVPMQSAQAIQILTQCLSASGGLGAATVQDYTETGTITYSWAGEQVQGGATLRGKGPNEFRLDASLSEGTRTWAINNEGTGTLIAPDGTRSGLPIYDLMTAGSLSFPGARINGALTNASTTISFVGLVTSDVGQAYDIHVVPPVDANLAAALPGIGAFDLYIDPSSFQLLELSETIWSQADGTQTLQHEIIFSNYTAASAAIVPYSITEKIQGQQTWSVTVSSVVFNTGLDDSIFSP